MFYLYLFLVGQVFCDTERLHGWNYINLHCRDNDNSPVDWWIIYKPPKGVGPWETGLNFSYITPTYSGRWVPSDILITGSSMLLYTLLPMYRSTYSDHLATVLYQARDRNGTDFGSSANGILMADELGGLWITHTVPGLPDLTRWYFASKLYSRHSLDPVEDRLPFPESEINNGHLIMCLSTDFITLNEIAKTLRVVAPTVLSAQVPETVREWLPHWLLLSEPLGLFAFNKKRSFVRNNIEFRTKGGTLRTHLMVRPPGSTRCLYKSFAINKLIVLDVYGHDKLVPTVCEKDYSVRTIGAISLKYPENVHYVNKETDRIGFAISTGGPWSRRGATNNQYWTCLGSSETEELLRKGSTVLCFDDYNIWRSFDTLKIKEPEC